VNKLNGKKGSFSFIFISYKNTAKIADVIGKVLDAEIKRRNQINRRYFNPILEALAPEYTIQNIISRYCSCRPSASIPIKRLRFFDLRRTGDRYDKRSMLQRIMLNSRKNCKLKAFNYR